MREEVTTWGKANGPRAAARPTMLSLVATIPNVKRRPPRRPLPGRARTASLSSLTSLKLRGRVPSRFHRANPTNALAPGRGEWDSPAKGYLHELDPLGFAGSRRGARELRPHSSHILGRPGGRHLASAGARSAGARGIACALSRPDGESRAPHSGAGGADRGGGVRAQRLRLLRGAPWPQASAGAR